MRNKSPKKITLMLNNEVINFTEGNDKPFVNIKHSLLTNYTKEFHAEVCIKKIKNKRRRMKMLNLYVLVTSSTPILSMRSTILFCIAVHVLWSSYIKNENENKTKQTNIYLTYIKKHVLTDLPISR